MPVAKKVYRATQSFVYADKDGKKAVTKGDICPAVVVKGRESLFEVVGDEESSS